MTNTDSNKKKDFIDRFEERLIDRAKEVYSYLKEYLPHPLEKIKTPPDWHWKTLIFTQVSLAVISGALSGIATFNIFGAISGMILMPLASLALAGVSSLLFYYIFQLFFGRTVEFRKLFTIIVLANIPFFIFQIASGFFKPIVLIGLGFSSILLIVGFVENFKLERKKVSRMIAIMYAAVVIVWALERLQSWYSERYF